MRDDQIIGRFRRRPRHDLALEETNAGGVRRQSAFDPLPRQLQHAHARVDTIDLDARINAKQFAEKSSIPLPDEKRPSRCADYAEASDPGPLQVPAESDRFQRPIRPRDRIKAHNAVAIRTRIGVSKTRSASAVC